MITRLLMVFASMFICMLQMYGQQVAISPIPQNIRWESEKAFDRITCFRVLGMEKADADAVALLKRNITCDKRGVSLVIGEMGDRSVRKYEKMIPRHPEGYYLQINGKGAVVAGFDGRGTYYGVQTLLKILSQQEVMGVTVTDYPDVAERGVVEGFYGNPWSHRDRLRQFDFYGKNKMNVYIYGPKDDPYHRHQWREPYPLQDGNKIKELVKVAKANKVDFVWAMHPGIDIRWNDEDRRFSLDKLDKMYDLGVRAFAIFFDDISGKEQAKASKQAEYLNFLQREFVEKHPDVKPLIVCPTIYNRAWAGEPYLLELGRLLDQKVRVMWTGNSVVDMINAGDMEWINDKINRKAYIWLNYPVNDYCIDRLLMGPTYGNDKIIADMLGGFVANPMEYAEASKVSLFSIADYTWNMKAYDYESSWKHSLQELMPDHLESFEYFCKQNIDLGPNGHGLRRSGESIVFLEDIKNFDNCVAKEFQEALYVSLRQKFQEMITVADELLADVSAPELSSEIAPWVKVMRQVGLRGLKLMDLYCDFYKGASDSFIKDYKNMKQLEQQQKMILSRDFKNSIKKPNPTVADEVVNPFIKRNLQKLVQMYKMEYGDAAGVFPVELLKEGRYYIKCNGLWLTDVQANPQHTGDFPLWKTEKDVINPQRQEWMISMDPYTGLYKIINAQDGRYLNSRGAFWRNSEKEPYTSEWHSYHLYKLDDDGKFAVQNPEKMGSGFWGMDCDRIVIKASKQLRKEHYIFEIIPVESR